MWNLLFPQINQTETDPILNFLFSVISYLLPLIVILIAMRMVRRQLRMIQPPPIKKPIVKTKLICPACKKGVIRPYNQGDQLFKLTDRKCPNCGEKMKVDGIFAESPKKKRPKGILWRIYEASG